MNCHTPSQQDAATSMLYVRGKGGVLPQPRGMFASSISSSTPITAWCAEFTSVFAPAGVHRFSSYVIIPASMPGLTKADGLHSKSDLSWPTQHQHILLNT
jgi:hypothetical protein